MTAWAFLARAVRSQVLSLKEREYIEAAKTLGLSTNHMIFREIFPNITYCIAINFLFAMIGAVYANIGLFFLALMPYNPTNWGFVLNDGQPCLVVRMLSEKGPLVAPILFIPNSLNLL